MSNIDETLAERGQRYGQFRDHAFIAQNLKKVMWGTPGWQRLADDQKQALEVIGDKIARILNGDPQYIDNWHDICGYSRLVEDRLAGMLPVAEPAEFVGMTVVDTDAWDHLPPAADDPQSTIVQQRSRLRQVIDDFWNKRSTVE